MRPSYSLEECNRMLALVRAVAREIAERRNLLRGLERARHDLIDAETPEGLRSSLAEVDAEIFVANDGIRAAVKELELYGLTLLRLRPITIHFPGITKRGPIVFCWQEGDDTIGHGHPTGEEQEPRRQLKLSA
jgi:hypothetical protein